MVIIVTDSDCDFGKVWMKKMRGNYYEEEKRHDIIIFQTRAGLQSNSFSQSCAGLTNHIRVLNHTGSTSIISQQHTIPCKLL